MPKGGGGGGGPSGGGGNSGGATWRGGKNDDVAIVANVAELATTSYDGRGGFDSLDMSALTTGVTIKLNIGPGRESIVYPDREFTGLFYSMSLADPDGRITGSISNIERMIGGSGDDYLYIDSSAPKTIEGGAGDDALGALGGNATLIGGSGADTFLVYHYDNILVGGTFVNGVAVGDGEVDTFIIGTSATILGFEIGIDRLQIETNEGEIEAILAASWQDTADGAQLIAGGKTVTLAGITAAQAATIPLHFTVGGSGFTEQSGGPGDDTFYGFASYDERYVLGSGSGHDSILFFDTSSDTLVFEDGGPASWQEVDVNGVTSLRGVYDGGYSSVTLVGLTAADVVSLPVEEPASAGLPQYPPEGDYLL